MGFCGHNPPDCSYWGSGEDGPPCEADPDISGLGVRALKACPFETDKPGHPGLSNIHYCNVVPMLEGLHASHHEPTNRQQD